MSSEADAIASLILIERDIYRFGGPILMILGSVSCVMSLMVFSKKNLRKNPCSLYLFAFNTSNLLLIFTSILFLTLSNGYGYLLSCYSLSFCRFQFYTMLVFDILSPSYLILAAIERILVTSPSMDTRQRSTRRLALLVIVLIALFWLLFHIHVLILQNFVQIVPGFTICYFQVGLHTTLISYYFLLIKGILIPLWMIILGLWCVKNIRTVVRIHRPRSIRIPGMVIVGNMHTHHSKDRQLLRILQIDIAVYVVFNLMIVIVLMYQQFSQDAISLIDVQIQSLLLSAGVFCTYIPYCVGCYTNLVVSKAFRHEVKMIVFKSIAGFLPTRM